MEEQETPVSQTEEPVQPTFDIGAELGKLDPQSFRKLVNEHPQLSGVIGGIIGIERQKAIEQHEAHRTQEDSHKRRTETDTELIKLLEDNEELVREYYPKVWDRLSDMRQTKAAEEIENLQGKTVRQIGLAIGRALADVPEWSKVPNEKKQELASLMQGKSDEEALTVFNHYAWQLVADVRAQEAVERYKTEDKAKDREALRQEEAAKLMSKETAPDLRKPTGTPSVNFRDMSKADFDRFWEEHKNNLR